MARYVIHFKDGKVADQLLTVTEGEEWRVTLAESFVIVTRMERLESGLYIQHDDIYPVSRIHKIQRESNPQVAKVPVSN